MRQWMPWISWEREQERRRQSWKTKRKERRKGKKIVEETFRTIGAIYIEPLASRPPPIFRESNESSREERDVKQEIFEALKHVTTMGEGLEKTLQGLWIQFPPFAPTFVIISDSKEEK